MEAKERDEILKKEAEREEKIRRRMEREERRRKLKKSKNGDDDEEMNRRIQVEERKLLVAQRKLESIRLLDELLERVKVNYVKLYFKVFDDLLEMVIDFKDIFLNILDFNDKF